MALRITMEESIVCKALWGQIRKVLKWSDVVQAHDEPGFFSFVFGTGRCRISNRARDSRWVKRSRFCFSFAEDCWFCNWHWFIGRHSHCDYHVFFLHLLIFLSLDGVLPLVEICMCSFTFGLIGQSILDKIHLRQVWLMHVFACNCSVCGVTSDNDLQRYSLSTAPFFFLLFFLCESIILIAQHQCCTHLKMVSGCCLLGAQIDH